MFRQIMIPLDGSALAERALPAGERLGSLPWATIHLVRVVDLVPVETWTPQIYVTEEMINAANEEARSYLDRVRERLAALGLTVRTALPTGYAASALLDYEQEAGIDLVVMASHGRTGLARYALGSVADRLVRYGRAPILLIRAFEEPVHIEHAVVGLDGSPRAESALDLLRQLTPQLIHEVTLVRAVPANEDPGEAEAYLRQVAARLSVEGLTVHVRVAQGEPAAAILDVAGTDKLIIATTHGRSTLGRWALGSVADHLAHGRAPGVLLLRHPGTAV